MPRARVLRTWTPIAVLGVALAGVAPSGSSAAPPTARATSARAVPAAAATPVLTGVSVSPGAVAVRGLGLVDVTVSATFADTGWGDPDLLVLGRTTTQVWDRSAPRELVVPLTRRSGSGPAGTFGGTVRVPSSAHGAWRVLLIGWPSDVPAVDPREQGLPDATLQVTGVHRPRLRYALTPSPLPYPRTRVTATATMSFDDTRAPVVGVPIGFGVDNACAERVGPSRTVRTNTRGAAAWSFDVDGPWVTCAWAPLPGAGPATSPGYARGAATPVLGTVTSAKPARASAPRLSAVPVTGSVAALTPPAGAEVQLQRLVGRRWRTVNEATVRLSGRYTVTANPPAGRQAYRVVFLPTPSYGRSTSRSFAIRGT